MHVRAIAQQRPPSRRRLSGGVGRFGQGRGFFTRSTPGSKSCQDETDRRFSMVTPTPSRSSVRTRAPRRHVESCGRRICVVLSHPQPTRCARPLSFAVPIRPQSAALPLPCRTLVPESVAGSVAIVGLPVMPRVPALGLHSSCGRATDVLGRTVGGGVASRVSETMAQRPNLRSLRSTGRRVFAGFRRRISEPETNDALRFAV